jgi:hypothetical protein
MAGKVHLRRVQLVLLVLIAAGSSQTYAQKFTVGVKAGATLSKSSFGDKDDKDQFTNKWKPGYFGAALVNLPMKKNFSFQTEAGFSQRGRRIEFNEATWLNNATYHFLDASMMLRKSYPLQWTKNIKGTWFFNVGPKVSYWLNGKGKITTGGTYVDPDDGLTKISKGGTYDYTLKFEKEPDNPDAPDFNTMYLSDVNRWLFGLDFGIGVDAPTTALQRFVFEVRFTSGNEKIISFSIDYTLNKVVRGGQKGKSTKKDVKPSKQRKSIDSLLR